LHWKLSPKGIARDGNRRFAPRGYKSQVSNRHALGVARVPSESRRNLGKAKLELTDVPALLRSLVWKMDEYPGSIAMDVDSRGLTNALAYARLNAERPG
jgi:hypothetical protein